MRRVEDPRGDAAEKSRVAKLREASHQQIRFVLSRSVRTEGRNRKARIRNRDRPTRKDFHASRVEVQILYSKGTPRNVPPDVGGGRGRTDEAQKKSIRVYACTNVYMQHWYRYSRRQEEAHRTPSPEASRVW